MIDDTPEKLSRNYGNLVRVSPFERSLVDTELFYLQKYLPSLAIVENVREVEKRGWYQKININYKI